MGRFEITEASGYTKPPQDVFAFNKKSYVVVDKKTGVNYLVLHDHNLDPTAITVLVDKDGKPIITQKSKIQ